MRRSSLTASTTPTNVMRSFSSSTSAGPTAVSSRSARRMSSTNAYFMLRRPTSAMDAADQRPARQHACLDRVFARVLELFDRALAVRQQPATRREDVGEAHDRERHADPREVEQAQVRIGHGLQQHAVDDQVRARADQRAHAREDDQVVHRQQQLRDRIPEARRPLLRDGNEQRHDRRVVDDARQQRP